MLDIEINGKATQVKEGSMVMDAANQLGIYIPHFCYHKKLSIAASCRMCLVQVEKAPKPLPACATPVTNGMKVTTHSAMAVNAQKGVMEFLLINHPLDCPVCDQGGECQLQDLAVGYGAGASRYQEEKRVVSNKDLGPLIATEMTRCIHCTRCVRFGQEIAGIMELGVANRGEHSEIMPFLARAVDSELSGNVIDLCPVGALTSKPFRFSARNWELARRKSVSPHCGLGANLVVQVKRDRVMRVLPLDNEEINECWLSDKDRFSYEGLNSPERLARPMIKQDGAWQEVEWQTALEYAACGLQRIAGTHGADALGALATPHSTLEELYLLQKLMRGLGCGSVDHRLRQCDFSADREMQGAPWLGMSIAQINRLDRVLVVGSTLRMDHPLLAQRLRQAAKKGAQINLINPFGDDLLMRVANTALAAPAQMPQLLAQVLKAAAQQKAGELPAETGKALAGIAVSEAASRIAHSLLSGQNAAVFLGNLAQHHPSAAQLHLLAQQLAALTGAEFGFLGEAANSVGAHLAGATPVRGALGAAAAPGRNAREMIEAPRKAYVLFNVEPELDCHNPRQALAAMKAAEMVVAFSAYRHRALEYADVMLPVAPFTETSGTFVNTEGRAQSFNGVVKPLGEARPGWKVLRVLGNLLDLPGFDYQTSEAVRDEVIKPGADAGQWLDNQPAQVRLAALQDAAPAVQRIGEVPIYYADAVVRRAPALQQTPLAAAPCAWMCGALLERLQLRDGDTVKLRQGEGEAVLTARRSDKLPDHCIRVAGGHPLTAALGGMFDEIAAERAAQQQKMAAG